MKEAAKQWPTALAVAYDEEREVAFVLDPTKEVDTRGHETLTVFSATDGEVLLLTEMARRFNLHVEMLAMLKHFDANGEIDGSTWARLMALIEKAEAPR